MTDDNSNTDNLVDMDNLDTFAEALFKAESTPKAEPVIKEKEVLPSKIEEDSEEIGDDSPATDEDTDAPVETEDEDVSDEDAAEDDEEEEQPKQKKGKKSFQERINELTAKAHEAERRERAVLQRLQEVEARSTQEVKAQPSPVPLREQLPADAPSPDAVDEAGESIYQLGEFDPLYIRDLTKFMIIQETAVQRQLAEAETVKQQISVAQQKLSSDWAERVANVAEEIPEIRENIVTLSDTFADIDPSYGEYLATTIMENERGPEIMHYLSQNIGEAQKIVASGPRAATLAIGRLEYILNKTEQKEERRDEKLVSNASPPPVSGSRGRGARTVVRPDTDDLDAFEKLLFTK